MIFERQIHIHAPEAGNDGRDRQNDCDRSQHLHDIVQIVRDDTGKHFAQLIDHLTRFGDHHFCLIRDIEDIVKQFLTLSIIAQGCLVNGFRYQRMIFSDGRLKIHQTLMESYQLIKIFIMGSARDLYLQILDGAIDFPQVMNETLRQFP